MITEWMLVTLLDYAKDGVIAGINQKDYDSILDKTLREFEGKYFGFSKTDFKKFTESPEVQAHLEQHLADGELDLEYLGGILSEFVNLERDMSGKTLLLDFNDKFETNLVKDPQLKDQLELRYHKSADHQLHNIKESMSQNHDEVIKFLKCVIQKDVQKSDRKLCFHGQEVSDDQIIKLATNALERARSKYEKGLSLTVLGKFDEAELQFDSAIEHNPECAKCYLGRGNAKYLQNKLKEACEDYSEAIKLDSTFAPAWYNKGNVLYHLENSDDALKCFDKAIEITPRFAEAWHNKGNALDHLGKSDEALKWFDKAIENNPKHGETWYNKGTVSGKLGKYDDALKCFDEAIRINPQFAEAWANKGITLDRLGKSDEAIKCFDKAIEINPQLAKPQLVKAWYSQTAAAHPAASKRGMRGAAA